MKHQPTILVTGATGAQGGSVAYALLAQNQFAVRCLTRKTTSPKALALQAAGATLVQGDMDDAASLEAAVQGCYGVFGVTNFWEHFEKEYEHGKNLVNAVQKANIRHFVFSTLPGLYTLSNGRLPVPHCDIKAALEQYTKSLSLPATFVHTSFYYENFLHIFPPQKGSDGCYHFGFPQGNTKMAMVSTEDIGGVVASIFKYPQQYAGRKVGIVGEDRTCAEYAATMSKVLKQPVVYDYIERETFAALGFAGAEELANMFEVQRLYIEERQLDLVESYGLNPAMQSFESWLEHNATRFALGEAEAAGVVVA